MAKGENTVRDERIANWLAGSRWQSSGQRTAVERSKQELFEQSEAPWELSKHLVAVCVSADGRHGLRNGDRPL